MVLGPVPLELIVLAKAAAHWLATALPMALAAPFLGLLLNLDPNLILPLAVASCWPRSPCRCWRAWSRQ